MFPTTRIKNLAYGGRDWTPLPAQPAPTEGLVTRLSVTDELTVTHDVSDGTTLVRVTVSGAAVRWLMNPSEEADTAAEGATLPAGIIDTRSVVPGATLAFIAVSGEASVEIEEC
jgi:hypothetical protein